MEENKNINKNIIIKKKVVKENPPKEDKSTTKEEEKKVVKIKSPHSQVKVVSVKNTTVSKDASSDKTKDGEKKNTKATFSEKKKNSPLTTEIRQPVIISQGNKENTKETKKDSSSRVQGEVFLGKKILREERENRVLDGKSFMKSTTPIESNRLSSSIHTGPKLIHKTSEEKKEKETHQGPRVVGIVGGEKKNRTDGKKKNFNKDGQNSDKKGTKKENFSKDKPNFKFNKDGRSYVPQNQESRGFSSRGRSFGDKESISSDLTNNKPVSKKFDKNGKRKGEKKETEMEEKEFEEYKKKKEEQKLSSVPSRIDIMENVTISELAKKMNLKANDIIAKLFKMGMMVTINQSIDFDTAEIICSEYNCEVHKVSLYDETVIESEEDREEDMVPRSPIVTIMGHVDHGKTKLLDSIRTSNVAEGEFGGITQHIGAYKVKVPGKDQEVVFLDTPGHAAFSMMRARGAQVTDIVVLVVAANDGVMPQTKEAIDHAKAAQVPIIVAINKIDLPDANPDHVKQQLSDLGLIPEEWGGQTLYCEISALKKIGIDNLLDTILLQAEMLELKANPKCKASGKVLESRIDQGRGTVATIMVEKGTLRVGDYFVAGIYSGRVRALFDDRGRKIKEAGPATPVEIIGLSDIPSAGDPFQVTEDEKKSREIASKRQELEKLEEGGGKNKVTLENLNEKIKEGQVTEFNVVIKGDVQGSVEALTGVLEKLSTPEIKLSVIRASAGAIIESDITLASASNAVVIGFNVRPTPRALALANEEKVEIKKYNIIYDVVDDIKAAMEGLLSPEYKEIDIGEAEVRETFRVPKVGMVAGCMITSGKVKRNSLVRVIRDSIQLNQELIRITSLKRFKDDAKEVSEGFECGIGLENFQNLQVGDTLEIVEKEEVKRKLDFS